ncbi:hypothetical protein ACFSC4_12405 [Deinococcus malanensis]
MTSLLLLVGCAPDPAPPSVFDAGVRELREHYHGYSAVPLEPVVMRARAALKAQCAASPCTP